MVSSQLCFSIRFIGSVPTFHGERDGGDPEWPPSPLRLFQAILDASASRWRGKLFDEYPKPALGWLQTLGSPTIIATASHVGVPFRIAVPNNDLDVWAGPFSKGNEPKKQPNELKTMMTVRPTHLFGDAVHYLYILPDAGCPYVEILSTAARSITHLGWGVDMVAGNANVITDEEATKLPGERWSPSEGPATNGLRVPKEGTLADLSRKHTDFLNRLSADGFRPVAPLTAFRVVGYRRATDTAPREWVAFAILKPDASGNRSFDTPRRCRDVAAWVRNATGTVCGEWTDAATFVHGHDAVDTTRPAKGERADGRFMYLPLSTINPALNRVESIRRVLIAAPPGSRDRIDWIRRRLPGQELMWDGEQIGLLNLLPTSDWVLKQYTSESRVWSTVTPVVLPGFDDPNHLRRKLRDTHDVAEQKRMLAQLDSRVDGLIRKALCQAGLANELVNDALLEWRGTGFRAGVELANRYARPERLEAFSAYHVRVTFPHPVRGPLAVGAGRYRGLGLFAVEQSV